MSKMQSDIKLINALHTYFVFPHFKFFQGGDPLLNNEPGFQARMISVRFFLMFEDLSQLGSIHIPQEFSEFPPYINTKFNVE